MRCVVLLTVLLLASVADVPAQTLATLEPGQRVRVTCPAAGLWKAAANFQEVEGDSLALLIHPSPVNRTGPDVAGERSRIARLPASGVTRLEAYRGRGTSTLRILAMSVGGLALGTGIGWTIGKAIDDSYPEGGLDLDLGQAWGAGIGAGVGLLAGMVVGSLIKTAKWEEVPLEDLRVSAGPGHGGFGIGLSVAF